MTENHENDQFRMLYEKYVSDVSAYAIRRAKPADAADVVSETFLIAWRRFDDVPPGESALPWLYRVARNVLSNRRRSLWRSDALSAKLRNHFKVSAPIANLETSTGLVGQAISLLSGAEQELLRLVAWEGLKPAELAVVLDISPEAARVRLHRARTNLRLELERVGFHE